MTSPSPAAATAGAASVATTTSMAMHPGTRVHIPDLGLALSQQVDSVRGKLLVAGPALLDPNFHRTVVLVCEHDENGAMGIVLNRPSPIPADQAIPELGDALPEDDTLWVGGPVQTTSVVVLGDFSSDEQPSMP